MSKAENKSNQKNERRNRGKKEVIVSKNEASVSFFLNASFFLFFLVSYTFLLFLHENRYPLILNNEILPEVLFACFGILVFSFLSLFAFSFSRFLTKIYLCVIVGVSISYVLGLIFPFNIGNYVAHYLAFLPQDILTHVANSGNLIAGCIAGFVFFIFLSMLKGALMAIISLPVLVLLFMLLNTSSAERFPTEEKSPILAKEENKKEKTENLIYLVLADHVGYKDAVETWQTLNTHSDDPFKVAENPSFIPAFYNTNKFRFYPATYLRYSDKHRNIASALNPSLVDIGEDLFSQDDAAYYTSSDYLQVFVNRNELFDELSKKGFHLNVYQSFPFDFCKGAGKKNVSKCVTYPAPLGALYQTKMSTPRRLLLLAGHWLNSTPLGREALDFTKKKLKDKIDLASIPFLGNPLSHSMPIGQPDVLANLHKDILKDNGKNAYFAHINLPHYPYVYDKNCQLRENPLEWKTRFAYSEKKELGEELKRWQDYNQQLQCTYNQINHLITDLKDEKLLNKTTIVIHGDNGAGITKKAIDEKALASSDKALNRFKNNMTTSFAIYSPDKPKAKVINTTCDVSTLVNKELLGRKESVCQPLTTKLYSKEEKENGLKWLAKPLTPASFAQKDFTPFYASWSKNGGLDFVEKLEERQNKPKITSSQTINFMNPPSLKKADKQEDLSKDSEDKEILFAPIPATQKAEKKEKEDLLPAPEIPPVKKAKAKAKPKAKETVKPKKESKQKPVVLAPPVFEEIKPELEPVVLETPVFEEVQPEPEPVVLEMPVFEEVQPEPEPVVLETPVFEEVQPEPAVIETPVFEEVQPEPAVIETPVFEEVQPEPAVIETPVFEEEIPAPTMVKEEAPEVASAPVPTVKTTQIKKPVTLEEQSLRTSQAKEKAKEAEFVKAKVKEKVTEVELAIIQAQELAKEAELAKIQAQELAKQAELAKAQAEEKAKAEALAKAKAEEKAKAEALAKAQAEEKAKAEALAKKLAEEKKIEDARLAAIEKVKAEVAERARIRKEAEEKAKEEAEQKRLEEERLAKQKAEEEAKKKKELEKKLNKADIIKETVIENVNDYGEVETMFFIERQANPNRFKEVEPAPQNEPVPEEIPAKDVAPSEPVPEVAPVKEEAPLSKPALEEAPLERELTD